MFNRRSFLRASGLTVAAASTGSLLAACGDDEGEATSQSDLIVIANAQPIPTLDPDLTAADVPHSVIAEICEPLLDYDPESRQLVPKLAESWTYVDETTLELKLREGVTFSNGEAFDAQAVKFTFERTQNPETKSVNAAFGSVTAVEVVDATTVRLLLDQPNALLTQLLTIYPMLPPQHTAEAGTELATTLVGTGPYKLKTFSAGYEVLLERNESYWGTKPAYREVSYRTVESPETQLSALVSGQIHIAADLLPQQAQSLGDNSNIQVISKPKMLMAYINLDSAGRTDPDGPMRNKLVRQALNHAVDIDSIIENVLLGYGTRLGAVAHPAQFGFDESIQPYEYDPEKAKDLLSQAGYPDGFEARLISQTAGIVAQAEAAQAIARDLEEVGIHVTIQTMTDPTAVGQVVRGGEAGPMFQFGNAARGVFDVAAGLSSFQSTSAFSYFDNEQFMTLYGEQAVSTDPERRKQLLSEIQELMHEEAPVLFQWAVHAIWAMSTDVDWPGHPGRFNRLYTAKPA
ncbi:ABC transporter substrate-binding protein [Solwaraspora sp. WMMB335]|uniref:ABC transporter substrate-binding protein n=1 Tax=Solwaraspora sp. WMMB335 TaxID=3404118 RepID=UPI003B93E7AE